MDEVRKSSKRLNRKRLLITLAVGAVPTLIFFVFNLWWLATIAMLLTLFLACFALSSKLYPAAFTILAVLAISWVVGSLFDELVPREWIANQSWRTPLAMITGAVVGLVSTALFWFMIFFVSTTWLLGVSDSFDIPFRQALGFVASRTFGTQQVYYVVENGKVLSQQPPGMLSKLGGPGLLIVRPGNAVVLEVGGKTSYIVDSGTHRLRRFEHIKKPEEIKGIVDLRSQFNKFVAEKVMTKDGIPLNITIASGFQIEPKRVTDERPSSHFEGGETTSRVLGEPEYPVYEATIRKAIFATTAGGWQGLVPWGPISVLNDVIGAYTLDQIFPEGPMDSPDPDKRVIKEIEQKVNDRIDLSWAGIWYKGLDILGVSAPDDIEKRTRQKWTVPVDHKLLIDRAKAERAAIVEKSEAQAHALRAMENVKYAARLGMINTIDQLLTELTKSGRQNIAVSYVGVIEELTRRVGHDESNITRYIEAMQAIIHSEGSKSFIITPPTEAPGFMPSPPAPLPPPPGGGDDDDK